MISGMFGIQNPDDYICTFRAEAQTTNVRVTPEPTVLPSNRKTLQPLRLTLAHLQFSLKNGEATLTSSPRSSWLAKPFCLCLFLTATRWQSKLLHHANLHFVLLCFPSRIMCEPSFSLQSCEARALTWRLTVYSKFAVLNEWLQIAPLDTALLWFLSNKPARCEEDQINRSIDMQITDRQTDGDSRLYSEITAGTDK